MDSLNLFAFFAFLIVVRGDHLTLPTFKPSVRVNKCCEAYELLVENHCVHVKETNESIWHPEFRTENGAPSPVSFNTIVGQPDCGSMQEWPIYYYKNSSDVLRLLPTGVLRHYLYHTIPGNEEETGYDDTKAIMYHDYEPGRYCMDKRIDGALVSEYASVCAPEHHSDWTSTEFLMRNVINPLTHIIVVIVLLAISIIYFVMPTLRDLVGNIVTTIAICLIVSEIADMFRLMTVFPSHFSIIVAETICYISLLGAFFWLNSLGYYIWKTFKSRNVYLRITDGKKYCYYSAYAWSCTIVMGFMAVFAHYTMDYSIDKKPTLDNEQESIGSLGIIIFFVPIAFTVIMNVFFFATTLNILNRMHTYGRIHNKLRHSFRMFLLLFLVMTVNWLFFLLSFTKFDGLIYCYILINALTAPSVLYICVFNQKHVAFLLQKTCCYNTCPCYKTTPEMEWGDEMTAMNSGTY